MNTRLQEIIRYKTGGKQKDFAEMMGWTPPYLAKLLRGESFGLSAVMTILRNIPEIDARWLIFGEGSMLDAGRIRQSLIGHVSSLLGMESYIPIMSEDEMREFAEAMTEGRKPTYDEDTMQSLDQRLASYKESVEERNNIINQAMKESICRPQNPRK